MGFYSDLQKAGFQRDPDTGKFVGDPNTLSPELFNSPHMQSGNVEFTQAQDNGSTPAPTPAQETPSAPREKMLQNIGVKSRVPAPRANPESARLSDGSRPPMPFDLYDPQTMDDVARSIREAAAQTEIPAQSDLLFLALKRIEVLEKKVGVLYPPMPRGSGTSGRTARVFLLSEDGTGSSGSKTSPCTFSYNVYDPDTLTLIQAGVGLTGRGRRDSVGKMSPANWGIGDFTLAGNVRLVFADEGNFRRACVPPP